MKHGLPPQFDALGVPAPLVIGVTGHCDLRPGDLSDLTRQVHQIFHELRDSYPSTPFILLSALAEGADRLVARVALEPYNRTRLVVPLPMPQSIYETDFQTASSLTDFRDLLAKADYSFPIPLPKGVSEDDVAEPGIARNQQYELLGQYLAGQSQILIALWDGVNLGKTGGTSEVVKFQLQGLPLEPASHLEPSELFPVYHVVTPRESNPVPAGTSFSREELYPDVFGGDLKEAARYYKRAFGNTDEFNRLVLHAGPGLAAEAAQSKKDCVGEFDEGKVSAQEARMLHRYAFADALAIRYQSKRYWADLVLHALVFITYLLYALSTEYTFGTNWYLMASILGLAWSLLLYLIFKHCKLDSKAEDYRALAEGCRVRFFWQLAGIPESVRECYLGEQRTELDWIRRALLAWEVDLESAWPGPWTSHLERIEFAVQQWVDTQQRYFASASDKSEKAAFRFKWGVLACLAVAILLAVVAGFCPGASAWMTKLLHLNPTIVVDALLALGAIAHHYGEGRAHREHTKQYARMLVVFQTAARIIRPELHLNNIDGARIWLRKLGDEALQESGSWVLVHRARPLELPHP